MLRRVVTIALTYSVAARADTSWHTGVDFHGTDAAYGARRPIGISGGVRDGRYEASVVVDPLVFILGWEMLDVTLGRWVADDQIKLNGGWRQTSGPLGGGRRYDEALLVGVDWLVPRESRFRLQFGIELEVSLIRHGAGISEDNISLYPLSADLLTRMEFLFHARFEFARAL